MKTVKVKVIGRVQGVGFRYFTYMNALNLNIKGYVRNSFDGSVEIIATGDNEKLDLFLGTVKKGPSLSRVDEMRIEKVDESDDTLSFSIR